MEQTYDILSNRAQRYLAAFLLAFQMVCWTLPWQWFLLTELLLCRGPNSNLQDMVVRYVKLCCAFDSLLLFNR